MAMTIDGHVVPDSIAVKPGYSFPESEILREAGNGVSIRKPYRRLEWTFNVLTATELAWWRTTVLVNSKSKVCVGTLKLNDPTAGGAEVTFSSCVIDAPDQAVIPVGNHYREIKIVIRNII